MKWDESEQILWSQQLALGYGAQPPLYTWLQWAVIQVLGPSVLALALVKHAAIGLTYVLAWLAARQLLTARGAFWVASGLLLMPPFGWNAVRDLTHTVLVTAMALGLCGAVLRLVQAPRPGHYALVGLFCGLGMMAKYSFALSIGAFFVACLTVPQARRALFQRGWWLAPLVGLLIFAPNGWWVLNHWHEATAATLDKMEISQQVSVFTGAANLLQITASTLLLWALVVVLAFRGQLRAPLPADADARWPWRSWAWPLLGRYLLFVGLAMVAMVVLGDVSNFKERWLLPLVAVVPLAFFVWRPSLQADDNPRGGLYTGAVLVFALIFFAMATARPWVAGARNQDKPGEADELTFPVPELAARLRQAGYDGRGDIVGADHMLAAMMRSEFPQVQARGCAPLPGRTPAACVAQALQQARATGRGLLLVSRARDAGWWAAVLPQTGYKEYESMAIPSSKMPVDAAPMPFHFVWVPPQTVPGAQP
ncbi:glycosyl transferase [Comamonas serinivorans]|uniref:Glycosyl transferase n=2 Tax=Comamonas serinivorans TaxID=1082851 RepID=A0A1Y0ESK4_9BURK|nr:glycosyl transferase [Comamonas serinivorans]